jgi:1,4-alpha-glucan branching enzyme
VRDLNALHRVEPALHAFDVEPDCFEWIDASDAEGGTLCFLRRGNDPRRDVDAEDVVVVLNLTPMPHERFRVGLPAAGAWQEVLNSDAEAYGGSGVGNLGRVQADPTPWHDRPYSALIVLPPLACLFFRPVTDRREGSQAS